MLRLRLADELAQALASRNAPVRASAATALGTLGAKAASALEALLPLKNDPDGGVKRAAEEAIRNIRAAVAMEGR